jgi:PilZ domain-containing protein
VDERREFARRQADWLADIYADDTIYTSPVRNLSLGGIEIMRPPLWKPKDNHFCKISLSDMVPSHTLEVRMEVCWTSEKAVGLKYHELKFKEKVKLNKIISDITRTMSMNSGHFVM